MDTLISDHHPIYRDGRYNIASERGIPEEATPEALNALRRLTDYVGEDPYLTQLTVGNGLIAMWNGNSGPSSVLRDQFDVVIWPDGRQFMYVYWDLRPSWVVQGEDRDLDIDGVIACIKRDIKETQ